MYKRQIINEIIKNDPYKGTSLLIRILIRLGRGQEAEKLLEDDVHNVITQEERTMIDLLMYRHDKNKKRLQNILNCKSDSPKIIVAKAEAAYNMIDELGDACEKYFIDAMKADKNDPRGYLYFGKFLLEYKKDEEKAVFLFQKAYDLGLEDKSALEMTSRNLAKQGKFEESLNLCQKVDSDWSHFRAGLILQKLGRHEEACEEFQKDLKFNPERRTSWSALGQSYVVLGRAKAAMSVAQEIRKHGEPDLDLEFQLNSLFEAPLEWKEEYSLKENPLRFTAYLQQVITKLRMFQRFGRFETCHFLTLNVLPLVREFVQIWGSQSSVLKLCGDYFVEEFLIEKDKSFLNEGQVCFMKRCEIDRRAEAFIDLARVLNLKDLPDQATLVLRRAVKSFTDHSGVWMSLGISFALSKQYSYARHCLCVAAKLATSMEMARSYACVAAIALLIDDEKLLDTATNAARSFNPYDPDVWQILIKTEKVNRFDASKIAFEFGSSRLIIPNLPLFALMSGETSDALNFSFMGEDTNAISFAFEALKKYDFALLFANKDDKERIERLNLLNSKSKISKIDKKEENEPLKSLQLAAEKIINGNRTEAGEIILSMINENSSCSYSLDLEKSVLEVIPKGSNFDVPHSLSHPVVYVFNAMRTMSTYEAAKDAYQKFNRSAPIVKNLVMEIIKNNREEDYGLALQALNNVAKNQNDREILRLLSIIQLKLGMKKEALVSLQQLSILSPSFFRKLKSTINKLFIE